jgi:hypothetical protein
MAGATHEEYRPTTTYFDVDPVEHKTRRKPNRFTLERRIGLPFSQNVYYSQAPLKSDDHLKLLSDLEGLVD